MEKDIPRDLFELGMFELQKSPVYAKMSDDEKSYYVTRSLEKGQAVAQEIKLQQKSIYQLIDEENIELIKKETHKYSGEILIRGEIYFTKKKCTITVYEDSIDSVYSHFGDTLPPELVLSSEEALAVHLSHEFFHYLEFKSGKTVSEELNQLQVKGLFGLMRQIEVLESSEIAAHAFAKEFCSLEVLPNFYDLHYIYQNKKIFT